MKNPSICYMGDQPYDNYGEYMENLFAAMDIFLQQSADCEIPFLKKNMEARGLSEEQNLGDWQRMIGERLSFSLEIGRQMPIETVLKAAGGDAFVRNCLVLSMLMAFRKEYGGVLKQLFPESEGRLDLTLCVRIFWRTYGKYALPELAVYETVYRYHSRMSILFPALEWEDDQGELVCDTRLMDILLGKSRYLPVGTTAFEIDQDCDPQMFREDLYAKVCRFLENDQMPLVMLWGDRGAGKRLLLKHAAKSVRKAIIFFDVSAGYGTAKDLENVKKCLLFAARECILFDKILAVCAFEKLEPEHKTELAEWLDTKVRKKVPKIFIVNETSDYRNGIHCALALELGAFNGLERIGVWKYYLEKNLGEIPFDPETLANTFNITPGQIAAAIEQAKLMDGETVTEEMMYRACYVQLDHGLEDKAALVRPSFGWEDLKLAPEDKEIIRDVCHCVKTRHTVLNEWDFGRVVPYGGGITVLFSGPPGTGKTMAAQVIAKELHMELYKIDLSQVIDKYVGETEKNIRKIFEQAKKSNSVLFFDEADSIFNKRLEASGANERFANIESSLLLQCIEEYSGITILATNNFSSIDGAFIRRFKYYLLFKEPDEAMRYEIWKSVIPKSAPVSREIDLRELAHVFEFTGAVIKNVILGAAYLAAWEKREIRLVDILKAVRREMTKNNLVLTREKMGSLGYMFDEMMKSGQTFSGTQKGDKQRWL